MNRGQLPSSVKQAVLPAPISSANAWLLFLCHLPCLANPKHHCKCQENQVRQLCCMYSSIYVIFDKPFGENHLLPWGSIPGSNSCQTQIYWESTWKVNSPQDTCWNWPSISLHQLKLIVSNFFTHKMSYEMIVLQEFLKQNWGISWEQARTVGCRAIAIHLYFAAKSVFSLVQVLYDPLTLP